MKRILLLALCLALLACAEEEPVHFAVESVALDVINVTQTTATFVGSVDFTKTDTGVEVGVLYMAGNQTDFTMTSSGVIKESLTYEVSGSFLHVTNGLKYSTTYSYRSYVWHDESYTYGEIHTFTTLGSFDLSVSATSNCYIVLESGIYKIKAVKGNSSIPVGSVSSASVLWESFGTSVTPEKGDLVSWTYYENDYVFFEIPSDYKHGNAVIAAKDADGKILWSWHIWLTEQPQEHVYYSNAGTMMDRNLGAISAAPGDVGALGLLYQWGRKDPFLGSSSNSDSVEAESTITWPSPVSSDSNRGTIEYAAANPTTFIIHNNNNYDWQYNQDNSRWQPEKTIYDPCPTGWRVPDGINGVWSMGGFDMYNRYDVVNRGISFMSASPAATWYSSSGFRHSQDGGLYVVGFRGFYWSCSLDSYNGAYLLFFNANGDVKLDSEIRALGCSVRCLQE